MTPDSPPGLGDLDPSRVLAGVPPPARPGSVARALRAAALFSPLLLPLAVLQFLLLTCPWLHSHEAVASARVVVIEKDADLCAALGTLLASAGGLGGWAATSAALSLLWLAFATSRQAYSWRRLAATLLGRTGGKSVLPLLALATGLAACWAIQAAANSLARTLDLLAGIRPTGPWYLHLLLGVGLATALAHGAVLGAMLTGLEPVLTPKDRLRPVAVGLLIALVACASLAALHVWLDRVTDVAPRDLPDAPPPPHRTLVALARDRAWVRSFDGRAGNLPLDASLARDAERRLAERGDQTLLATSLETLVLESRLASLDIPGARALALACVRRRGSQTAFHALSISLACATADARVLHGVEDLLGAPDLRLGTLARLDLARALARQGQSRRAGALLGAEERADPAGTSLVLGVQPPMVEGAAGTAVAGVLHVGGRPWQGRVALVDTSWLFALPPAAKTCSAWWLLHVSSVAQCDPAGSFRFDGSSLEEQALVLVLEEPGSAHAKGASCVPSLPPLVPAQDGRELQLGTVEVTLQDG